MSNSDFDLEAWSFHNEIDEVYHSDDDEYFNSPCTLEVLAFEVVRKKLSIDCWTICASSTNCFALYTKDHIGWLRIDTLYITLHRIQGHVLDDIKRRHGNKDTYQNLHLLD